MNKTTLKSYARLIAKMGVNIQKGQAVNIYAELDQPEFVAILVDECYRAGAGKVNVEWSYQPLTKLNVRHCKASVLEKVEDWEIEKMKHRVETLPAMIYLESSDPDGLAGINQQKLIKASQKKRMIMKPYRDEMENKYQWCIAAVPGKAWAKSSFPSFARLPQWRSSGRQYFPAREPRVTARQTGEHITRTFKRSVSVSTASDLRS